ncbi:MAG: hypothetical protein JW749_07405 [Sedimentisphaerales bacterium]|nr:hypothetical protein [Sedimentisphaerales bacterium]
MSPNGPVKKTAASNIYTVILAIAFGLLLATVIFVACKCYFQYGTLFKIP